MLRRLRHKNRRDKLYDKLRSVSGNFEHRLCAEEESAGPGSVVNGVNWKSIGRYCPNL